MSKEYFAQLKKVPEDSTEAKLFQIIDDIDTASDIFKPSEVNFKNYCQFINMKIKQAHKIIESDGYKLYYADDSVPFVPEEPQEAPSETALLSH